MNGRAWTARQLKALRQMAAAGYSGAEVAQKLQRSVESVYSRLQVEGVTLTRKNRYTAAKPVRQRRRRSKAVTIPQKACQKRAELDVGLAPFGSVGRRGRTRARRGRREAP